MSTFTFVINDNYKRCFVHQYQSEILTNDLLRELVHDTSYISSKMKPLLINETMECYHDKPVKLNRINNVWRDIFIIDNLKSLYSADVAKKYHEGCDTLFPLSESTTFTFITHIRHYNVSYQFKIDTLEEGLLLWATNLNILNRQQRKILLKYIQKSKNNPESVEGVKNVWSTSYRIFRPLLTLHIIKTVSFD